MGEGSVVSSFQFKSFKIDSFDFELRKELQFLVAGFGSEKLEGTWKIKMAIRNPQYFKSSNLYIGGLDMVVHLVPTDQSNALDEDIAEVSVLELSAGISGLFLPEGDRFPKETEENLARLQIPSLLLPYLRAAITSFLANAGIGGVVLPLINIYSLAQQQDIDLEVVEL